MGHEPQEESDDPVFLQLRVHDVRRFHREERCQQQAIQEGFVVGDDERALVGEDRGITGQANPKQQLEEGADDRLKDPEARRAGDRYGGGGATREGAGGHVHGSGFPGFVMRPGLAALAGIVAMRRAGAR